MTSILRYCVTVGYIQDSDAVAMIKELIETRIRPTMQDDGGDIVYHGFVDGLVQLEMCGSCKGCPSSAVTLRNGIEVYYSWYFEEGGVVL